MTYEINCGEPMPDGVEVRTTRVFTHSDLSTLLIKQVIDALPREQGTWGGHVDYRIRSDDASVTATVSVWKEK